MLTPFKVNVTPGEPQGIKLYLEATNEIYLEADKLDNSVSNDKDINDHFLSQSKNMAG